MPPPAFLFPGRGVLTALAGACDAAPGGGPPPRSGPGKEGAESTSRSPATGGSSFAGGLDPAARRPGQFGPLVQDIKVGGQICGLRTPQSGGRSGLTRLNPRGRPDIRGLLTGRPS